jgi:hypothetical protein
MVPEIRRWTSRSEDGWALAHTVATQHPHGCELEGVLVQAGPSGPLRVHYRIEARADGTARRLTIEVQAGQTVQQWALAADGHGRWFQQGVPLTALTGALDVGLWCVPDWHALTLRRLQIPFGGHQDCLVAALPGPDADWTIWHLRYTHVSGDVRGHRYHVQNLMTEGMAELWVDHDGWLVSANGQWSRA